MSIINRKKSARASPRPLITSLLLMLLQGWAIAAEAPVTPGSVQDTLPGSRPRQPSTPPQVIFPVQPSPSQHDPRAKRFRVNAFDMTGNTVYRTRLLKTVLERFVDLELNLYDLNRAADTITAFYHDRGYTLARAVIPAQKVTRGVVHIRIVEGRFGKVTVSGNRRHSTGFLKARTGLLTPGALVSTARLENNLLLLNDLPGVRAKVVLEPGAQFGTSDAEIQIKEALIDGNAMVNNYGRAETGQKKIDVSLNLNSPFGWGDQLALSGSIAQQKLLRYGRVAYSFPVNTEGTRFTLGTSKAAFDVSGALAALGVSGEVKTEDATITHPLVRSRADNQSLTLGAKRTHLKQSALGSVISDSTIKVLSANYHISRIHRDASVTNFGIGLTSNFHGNGNSTTQQTAVFARFDSDLTYTTPFYQKWDLFLRGNIVFSKERLPDTEKFSLGGPSSVRAFRPSEVRGDSGYLAAAELRRPFSVGGKYAVFRLTAETGEVTYKMPGFTDSRDRLRSVGLGATLYPFTGGSVSLDLATPVRSSHVASDGNKDLRIWINISAGF